MTTYFTAYVHTQSVSSAVWTINHNLGHKPAHDVMVDVGPERVKIYPSLVVHVNDNTLQLTFNSSVTGVARLV